MRHVIETGSDIATVCAFDPDALPVNCSEIILKKDRALLQLVDEGCLWWHSTGGDGTYLFHVFVNEEPPGDFAKYSIEIGHEGKLIVSTGFLCICGAEDIGDIIKHAQSRSGINVPAGEYSLRAWSLDWPENVIAERCEEGFSRAELRKRRRLSLLVGLYVAATMITAFVSLVATIRWLLRSKASLETALWLWGATVLLVAVIPRLFPKPSTEELKRIAAEQAVLSEFPNFVLALRKAA